MTTKLLHIAGAVICSLGVGFAIGVGIRKLILRHRAKKETQAYFQSSGIETVNVGDVIDFGNKLGEALENAAHSGRYPWPCESDPSYNTDPNSQTTNKFSDDGDTMKHDIYEETPAEKLGYVQAPAESALPPHLISSDIFETADPGYEKVTLDYYTEDGALVAEDEPVHASDTIGTDNLKRFAKRNDLMYIYVRNERTATDYEVAKVVGKWYD